MNNQNKEIGRRLREIREISNEGGKLSARQFAFLLDETTDKILNYENGRASISIQLLINLYNRGFNPIYILTGEGSVFADNNVGRQLADKMEEKFNVSGEKQIQDKKLTIDEMIEKARAYNVAAGDILKAISKNKEK